MASKVKRKLALSSTYGKFGSKSIGRFVDWPTTNMARAHAAFAIEQGLRAIERAPRPIDYVSRYPRWPFPTIQQNSIYGKTLFFGQVVTWADYQCLWSIQVIEQFVRALDRWKIPTCIEHGQRKTRCAHQYHANGKVRHGCVK